MLFKNFIYLVYKQKFMMIATSLIAVVLTIQLTKKMPDSYSSSCRLATGLVDQTDAQVLDSKEEPGEVKLMMQFANLIQSMQLKKIVDQVSYKLILNDLSGRPPFRKKSKMMLGLSKAETARAIEVFTEKYQNREDLVLFDKEQKKLNDLLVSMDYDAGSLKAKLSIFRVSYSDYLDMTFDGDSPQFCAFVLNQLCTEFITYYNQIVRESHLKGVNFLDTLLKEKKDDMKSKMDVLKQYKIKNRVLSLNAQASSIFTQIAEYESRLEITEKDIAADRGTIKSIDRMFDPKDRMYLESTFIKINLETAATKENIKRLTEQYIISNFNPKIKLKIDSLNTVLAAQIAQLEDKYIINPLVSKQTLVARKLDLQIQMELAENSIPSYKAKLAELNAEFDRIVPHEAEIQSYETEIDMASKEYIEILKRYNQSTLESNIMPRIKQIELAMPGPPAPSKKGIFIAVSGIVPIVLYIVVLFVIFLMDDSLKTSKELGDKTNVPVLGHLMLLGKTSLNLPAVWNGSMPNKETLKYKELLRSTRFEVEREMQDCKLLVVTSIAEGEGKSFICLSLAYALLMAKKKILLIDGNFSSPSISQITKSPFYLEDYLDGKIGFYDFTVDNSISILANKAGDTSLYELKEEKIVREKIDDLKTAFDLVIIDTAPLGKLNKSKEWIDVSEKVLSVFQANQSIDVMKDLHVNYLKELNEKYMGWVLNKVVEKKSRLRSFLIWMKQKTTEKKN